jgi:2-methylisocitrate lyase-like PEP mutase family enzyme
VTANTRQIELARRFASLHVKGSPLVLYNAWDVGSAKAVAEAGAKAIATGSWSVAAANGFDDREKLPLDRVIDVISRIVAAVELPVTLDFESGYARDGQELTANIERVLKAGVVGINFEDRRNPDDVMYTVEEHCERISTVRAAADAIGVPLFINARTDVFILNDPSTHASHVGEAIARGKAYAAAGANGFFVPVLKDAALLRQVCGETPLPVNVMFAPELPALKALAELGVARLSYGPRPYREMMASLTAAARAAMQPG